MGGIPVAATLRFGTSPKSLFCRLCKGDEFGWRWLHHLAPSRFNIIQFKGRGELEGKVVVVMYCLRVCIVFHGLY
jgi:hypothetical protein